MQTLRQWTSDSMYPSFDQLYLSWHFFPTLMGSLQGTAALVVPIQVFPFCLCISHVGFSPTKSVGLGGGGPFLFFGRRFTKFILVKKNQKYQFNVKYEFRTNYMVTVKNNTIYNLTFYSAVCVLNNNN